MTEPNSDSPMHIQVRNLWKVFGRSPERALSKANQLKTKDELQAESGLVVALRNLTFQVNYGETFVVMGLSGSGKSTLVRCLIRLIEKTSGAILVDGEDVTEYSENQLKEFRRSKMAMIFQQFGLLPHRNVLDNVAYGLEVRGVTREARYEIAERMLELVGLDGWEGAGVQQLSGGMQQRVGLARALAVEPEIMLMDEPFSGLDPLIRKQMRKELSDLQREINKTIVFITHDLDEAVTVGDRIAIMRDGEIIQMGSPKDIVLDPVDEFVAEFTEDISKSRVLNVGTIMEVPALVTPVAIGIDSLKNNLKSSDASYTVCIDWTERVLGVVTRSSLDSEAQLRLGLEQLLRKSSSRLTKDTSIEDAILIILDSETPVPVVDNDSKLLGIVTENAILRSIGPRR